MNNPILNILPDNLYVALMDLNLLNKKTIRDIEIKRKYVCMRNQGMASADALELVLQEYPYLQFDTLRKIVYSVKLPEEAGSQDVSSCSCRK